MLREMMANARRKKAEASAKAQELIKTVNSAEASDSDKAEARSTFDTVMAEIDTINGDIDRMQRQIDNEATLQGDLENRADQNGVSVAAQQSEDEQNSAAFRAYLVGGFNALDEDQQARVRGWRAEMPRNAQSTTPAEGGITVPTTTVAQIETAMAAFGGVRRVATVLRTGDGGDIIMPTANDTARKGRIVTEAAAAPAGPGVPFGSLPLQAFNYTSDVEPISIQLIQDSNVNIEQYIGERLGERIGRAQAEHFATGDGSGKPNGIVNAAQLGFTAAANNAIAYSDLVNLEHSVDAAYRASSSYLLGDDTLKALRLLEDTDGRPLWQAGLAAGAPDTINGRPFEVDYEMSGPASTATSMIFGQLSKYHIRDVVDVVLFVLREKYAENYQVGLVAFHRTDGDLLDAGTGAVRRLTHPV